MMDFFLREARAVVDGPMAVVRSANPTVRCIVMASPSLNHRLPPDLEHAAGLTAHWTRGKGVHPCPGGRTLPPHSTV